MEDDTNLIKNSDLDPGWRLRRKRSSTFFMTVFISVGKSVRTGHRSLGTILDRKPALFPHSPLVRAWSMAQLLDTRAHAQ